MKLSDLSFIVIFSALLALPAMAAPVAFVERPVRSFGEMPNNQTINETFFLRNQGDEPLEVKSVRATCGCTVAQLEEKVIPPGSEVPIEVEYKLQGKKGRQTSSVILTTNDPKAQQLTLTLNCTALSVVEIIPDRFVLGQLVQGTTLEKEVEIRAVDGKPFAIDKIKSSLDTVKAETVESAVSSTNKIKITIGPLKSIGVFNGNISLTTSHDMFPVVNIPLTGNVMGVLSVTPAELVLSNNGAADTFPAVTRYIVLSVNGVAEEPLGIKGVELPENSGIVVDISTARAGSQRIKLSNLRANSEMDGKSIKILTSNKDMPEVTVPVRVLKPVANKVSVPNSASQPIVVPKLIVQEAVPKVLPTSSSTTQPAQN